ncbi:hypothetical protein M408DRAFT_205581 [Serendipita vermifera MAFF 305830]|uniref:Uncharacterized protein n=1 Tax=Serendipita vermifera MAFF 305830 TaxID=933852 RepID=A0A0C3AM53_SERVB|nr:hypothetical protein M408DRAFT_205581 [Serendipita vermifera MAFF 305830]
MSNTTARSVSRGRESNTYASSGRGGAGNIVPASGSPDAERRPGEAGPDDYSLSRGRELPPPSNQTVGSYCFITYVILTVSLRVTLAVGVVAPAMYTHPRVGLLSKTSVLYGKKQNMSVSSQRVTLPHSGLSKITNLFHRGSRDATKFAPEVPEH